VIRTLFTKGLKEVLTYSSRTKGSNKLWILIFHRVLEYPDPLREGEVDRMRFDQQMSWLSESFNVLSLNDAIDQLNADQLPSNAVTITFDDGYADNLHIATPILKKYNFPATVFVSTGFLDGGRMWNDTVIESIRNWPDERIDLSEFGMGIFSCKTDQDKRNVISIILTKIKHKAPRERQALVDTLASAVTELPSNLMLTTQGVKDLHLQGIEIGAHTVNHPILAALGRDEAQAEIEESKQELERIIGKDVSFFAYPNGRFMVDYTAEHVDMMGHLGFKAALSTHAGVSNTNSDVMQLSRFTPWDTVQYRFLLRAAKNYWSIGKHYS